MPKALKGSIIFNLILSLCRSLAAGYQSSRFKGFASACGVCFRESFFCRLVSRYFNKAAYFEHSLTYRFILWLVKIFDKPVGAIGGFFRYITRGSLFISSAEAVTESSLKDRFNLTAVIGVFISLGYALGLLLKGAAMGAYAPAAAVFAAALVVFAVGNRLDYIKHSLIYRLVKSIVG